MNIEMNEQEQKILIEFLKRVQLSGAEVPAFVQILNKINKIEEVSSSQ